MNKFALTILTTLFCATRNRIFSR